MYVKYVHCDLLLQLTVKYSRQLKVGYLLKYQFALYSLDVVPMEKETLVYIVGLAIFNIRPDLRQFNISYI